MENLFSSLEAKLQAIRDMIASDLDVNLLASDSLFKDDLLDFDSDNNRHYIDFVPIEE